MDKWGNINKMIYGYSFTMEEIAMYTGVPVWILEDLYPDRPYYGYPTRLAKDVPCLLDGVWYVPDHYPDPLEATDG